MRRPLRHSFLAALFVFVSSAAAQTVLAAGVPIDAATPDQKKTAQSRYEQGTKAFAAGKFDVALQEFTASYDTVASPNAHFMMARAMAEGGDPAGAYNELVVVEREAKGAEKYAATLEQSVAQRGELVKKVGLVTVEITGAAGKFSVRVAGKEITPGEPRAVAPGMVTVEVSSDGKPMKTDSAQVGAGETHPFKIDLAGKPGPVVPPVTAPEPEPSKKSGRTGFWIGAGVFGAVAAGGVVMGAVEGSAAKSQFNDMEAKCPKSADGKHVCPSGYDFKAQADSGNQKQLLANVGWVIAGVGGAGAATMIILGATKKSGGDTKTGGAPFHFRVTGIDVGLGALGAHGTF